MTCIVPPEVFTSKKTLQMLADIDQLWVEEPSPFSPRQGQFNANTLAEGESVVVTNHPRRTKFAQVLKHGGKVIIK